MTKKIFSTLFILVLSVGFTFAQQLKVSVLGDSYSTFEGYVSPKTNYLWYFEGDDKGGKTDVVKVEDTWWWDFCETNGYELERNNSSSGTTICNTGYKGEDVSHNAFLTRVNDLGDPDIILIFGATNDLWAHSPLGEYKYSKWTKQELYSFRPAMSLLLTSVKERYPEADIYFMLNNLIDGDVRESILKLCKRHRVDCIKLQDIDMKTGHPSIKGMKQISEQISSYIAAQK